MATLVTLGCSFTMGDGCYDLSLGDYENDYISFRDKNMDNFLHNSIGSNIQKYYGFKNFINYGYGGSSNVSQYLKFFENLPDDDNVSILWQLTFNERKFYLKNQRTMDGGTHMNWVIEYYKQKMVEYSMDEHQIRVDDISEYSLYINALNEFCKSKNWNLLVYSWQDGLDSMHKEKFSYLSDIIIPFKNPIDTFDKTLLSPLGDGHPNADGYKIISNKLVETINKNNMKFGKFNEIPTNLKRADSKSQIFGY